MILKEVSLRNIRSYIDETIPFPQGSVLLAGDIGCGKSSLLLAIEFALFGASRTDLPAELLLRKGTTSGSVSLTFELPGKRITVARHLKKDKESIKQTAGEIVINGIKKELTPIEMKAEILELLGYPEDLLTKNKNYIYRYTVYTPQEEMKFILQEDAETRLNVLRRVFNIDKYNIIRENTALYLKGLRVRLAELRAKTEPLELHLQKQKGLQEEQEQLQCILKEQEPKRVELQSSLVKRRETVQMLEQKFQQVQQIKQHIATATALRKEYDVYLQQTIQRKEGILLALKEITLPPNTDKTMISAQIREMELSQQEQLQKKTSITERISFLQKQIGRLQQELEMSEREGQGVTEKERRYNQYSQEVCQKEELLERKKQIEELFERTQSLITKNQTLLSQSREMQERVATLSTCPTCIQQVTHDHKQKITEQEMHKVRQAEVILGELQKKRAAIWQQREDVLRNIEELLQKENLLAKISVELEHFAQKQEMMKQKKEELRSCAQENNRLVEEQKQMEQKFNVEALSVQIAEKQQQQQLLVRREYLQKQEQEMGKMVAEAQQKIKQIQEELAHWEAAKAGEEEIQPQLEKEKMLLTEIQGKERDLSVYLAQIKTRNEMLSTQMNEVQELIVTLTAEKEKLNRVQEIHHWLETFFINLTYTIEKQVMVRVHRLFNQFFQEWFAMMIDDEQVLGRIDDTFTPIIEQNGHEISFLYLSGGERTSAALAYRLALNRVINDVIHSIKTKDVLILDEPTDGFSTEQLDKMRDVLEKLGLQQIILVSHESKIESFVENVIRVRKEGHVSSVM